MSPDFRQRASSNASSCGRLSPIRAQDLEPDWGFPVDYQNTTMTQAHAQALEELTGSIADELTLCTQQQQQQQGSVLSMAVFVCYFFLVFPFLYICSPSYISFIYCMLEKHKPNLARALHAAEDLG